MEVTQATTHMRGPAPSRSLSQRMAALRRANDIRSQRAEIKRRIKAGNESVTGLIADPPEYIDTMKVWDLMIATPKFGRVKVNRILTQVRVSPSKTVGGLSERQRRELMSFLRR